MLTTLVLQRSQRPLRSQPDGLVANEACFVETWTVGKLPVQGCPFISQCHALFHTSGGRDETSNPEARPDPANPAAADAVADRERRRERKRQARRRREEAGYILKDLRSGERILYLQEVPRVKASHCRAWDCAITRLTRSPIIRSHYRFALKGSGNMYYGGGGYCVFAFP